MKKREDVQFFFVRLVVLVKISRVVDWLEINE